MSDNKRSLDKRKIALYIPFLLALFLALGIGIGYLMSSHAPEKVSVFTRTEDDKVGEILNYIQNRYVDTVNTEELYNKAINEIFSNLDPHSMYISPDELAAMSEPLRGHFEGIGVEFFIVDDTITIVSTIEGGPSEGLGIQSGDKIIEINDSLVAGVGITNQDVIKKLKGPADTRVRVSIKRSGVDSLLHFTITRGSVNIASVDAAYMVNDSVGYIKISRFAANTHEEFVKAAKKLKARGMKKLILDLRDNGGGYLDQATRMADEFLSGEKLLVYTEGRAMDRRNYRAGSPGVWEEGPLVLLLNENSASASEILAGALQDWGRATIIGRRSFGKALVQEEYSLQNGGAMRLTVAKYYTPKGRSIQRSYRNGTEEYRNEHYDRVIDEYEHSGEYATHDTASYGIKPDVYVPFDTSLQRQILNLLLNRGLISRFSYHYFSNHRSDFESYENADDFVRSYEVPEELYLDFLSYSGLDTLTAGPGEGSILTAGNLEMVKPEIKKYLKAYFGKQLFYYDGFFPVYYRGDPFIEAALRTPEAKT